MAWDIVRTGSFHRHIMTSAGTAATIPRAVQLGNEFTFAAMPTMDTVETHSIAPMHVIDTSCMFQV